MRVDLSQIQDMRQYSHLTSARCILLFEGIEASIAISICNCDVLRVVNIRVLGWRIMLSVTMPSLFRIKRTFLRGA